MDLRQTKEWGKYLEYLGWESVYLNSGVAVRIRRLGPVAVLKVQRPEVLDESDLQEILTIRKKYHGFLTKIEPLVGGGTLNTPLRKFGFRLDGWPLSVSKTIVIDLAPSEEEILARFSKDGRYCLRQAEKNNLKIKNDAIELVNFYTLFQQTASRGHFWVPSVKEMEAKVQAFGEKAIIFLSYQNEIPVAGALVFVCDTTAYYLHAGSILEGQKLEAPYLLIWEIIKKAKSLGCTKLDLEGIYDERFPASTKNWQGFTTFKKKFGGEELTFPGAFSRYF